MAGPGSRQRRRPDLIRTAPHPALLTEVATYPLCSASAYFTSAKGTERATVPSCSVAWWLPTAAPLGDANVSVTVLLPPAGSDSVVDEAVNEPSLLVLTGRLDRKARPHRDP